MPIRKTLRNKLLETKENKTKLLQESNIVKNRFNFILESNKPKNKKELKSVFVDLLSEMVYLHKQGFANNIISENVDDVFEILSRLYKGNKEEVLNNFKLSATDWIVNSLNLSGNETMKNYLLDSLNKTDLNDVPKLLTDYEFLGEKISNAVVESFMEELNKTMGGDFMVAVKTSIEDVLRNSDVKEKIKNRITGITRPMVDNMDEKFENKLNSIKSSLIPKSDIQA